MTDTLRASLLVNPAARGVGPNFDATRILRYLAKHGIAAGLVFPVSAADATAQARASAEAGDDLCFVVGGDGSVRDAALGLAGTRTALAALPAGTVNIWAREAGIPRRLRAALDAHIHGQTVAMDLGRAGDHCFLLMAGVGWDAEIAGRVSKRLKKAVGDLAYIAQGLWMAPRLRSRPAQWYHDGRTTEDTLAWMLLGNTRVYGGKIQLTREATITDGLLDVLAMCPQTLGETLRLAGKLVARRRTDPRLHNFRTTALIVETPGLAVQLDGDYAGQTPMTFTVDPGALLVRVPAGPLPRVFGDRETRDGEPS